MSKMHVHATATTSDVAEHVERDLGEHGFVHLSRVFWNLSTASLYEAAIRRGEGLIAEAGPLACRTGAHTGRSPNDKFIVDGGDAASRIAWGPVNRPLAPGTFETLRKDLYAYLQGRELFVQDCFAGADPTYRLPVRVITEYAWHSLFARNLFIVDAERADGTSADASSETAPFTVVDVPSFQADPSRHGTRSGVFVVLNLDQRLVLIGGTAYAGEIKKSIFSVMNYLLPLRQVMPMHCSANIGREGDVALFFGLSGTGKTTLSSDPARSLIGDDEHGWSDRGVFNIEGGCYAKLIKLSAEAEPQIHATTRRFGTVLENVVVDPLTRELDLDADRFTENTRGAYPLSYIDNYVESGAGGHPSHIVMLTADAFGVLPPIAKLTPESAMYHFLSGYTAKVAGTETGVTEPKATFSTCFGSPFLPLAPEVYARFLGEKIARHGVHVWLVNTGWSGGPYGVGARMKIAHTRAMIHAALSGMLDTATFRTDPVFNLAVPTAVSGVPGDVLTPRDTWTSAADYDAQAAKLARMFVDNFARFADSVGPDVTAAGPRA